MSAPHSPHWQQFRSSHLGDTSAIARESAWQRPPLTSDSAWLYGAGAAAVVFVAVWYWQGLGLPDVSTDVARSYSHVSTPLSTRMTATRMTATPMIARPERPRPQAALYAPPQLSAARRAPRLLPAAAQRRNSPQPIAAASARPSTPQAQLDTPDMDLMDVPSSPLEQLALYSARARQESSAAELEPGTLRINSRPWAHVFIDGQHVGNTPLRALRISAGQHSVRLTNPDFSMTKSFSLRVEAGESITRIEALEE